MPKTLVLLKTEIGVLQFNARPRKKLVRPYLKNQTGQGGIGGKIMI
jgi:hypothetical protein